MTLHRRELERIYVVRFFVFFRHAHVDHMNNSKKGAYLRWRQQHSCSINWIVTAGAAGAENRRSPATTSAHSFLGCQITSGLIGAFSEGIFSPLRMPTLDGVPFSDTLGMALDREDHGARPEAGPGSMIVRLHPR